MYNTENEICFDVTSLAAVVKPYLRSQLLARSEFNTSARTKCALREEDAWWRMVQRG